MLGGINTVAGLEIRFDSTKIESASYGDVCWEIFWQSFDSKIIGEMLSPTLYLFAGDSGADIFSICIETLPIPGKEEFIFALQERLENNQNFLSVAAAPQLQRYNQSVEFDHFAPFLKFAKFQFGKFEWEPNSYIIMAKAALEKILNK